MTGRLFPVSATELPLVAGGDGVYLHATDGTRYLDGSSGAVAANLGHGDLRIAEVLAEQARTVAFAHRTHFRSRPAVELAELVGEHAPGGLCRSIFSSSGSEANELALRLALAYSAARGHAGRVDFVSRTLSYHGSTLGALSLTGQARRRAGVEPLLHGFPRLHAGDPFDPSIEELRAELAGLDPQRVAAVVTEPVGGASSGALVPPPRYYEVLRSWCDEHDVLWIADEVMCGFGRTGRWFATEYWNAVPDLLVFGKGISGGYGPLAGVVATEPVTEAVLAERGYVSFGHTYTNTPLTAAVGVAVIREMERRGLVAHADEMGRKLEAGLRSLAERHRIVWQCRGLGLLRALELGDVQAGQPWPSKLQLTQRLLAAARDVGLLLYPAVQGARNGAGDGVLVAPPLIISPAELAELIEKLDMALSRVDREHSADRPGR
ncbi:aminotransferase family protein [Qaidamihabitans albus]|uniref:aminotransferase family protein n=1 Tax=Qaidamihabitans albus TaxID=2795733 RepID=UPI0018F1B4F2|nr:aminotransferase class III-fold pyridoxal phosphate-dependent enzyme [Qaidamihabitans albus]